ncbi:hypothetical protein [Roseateles sp.]|uniref:hypothetical protein n=1 Tax=Roseateles sp. TaxID=1971397 RepID=UPI003BA79FF5
MTLTDAGYLQRRSGAAAWSWLIVVLLHLLGLGLLRELQRSEPWPRHASNAAQNETRSWLVAIPLLRSKPAPQAPAKVRAPALASSSQTTAPSSLVENPEIKPSAAPTSTAISNTLSKPISSTTASPAEPKLATERLNLSLPARPASAAANSPAQMAALDPRGNTRRPDMGARMAEALGSDPSLREEVINPGHRRFRQGSTCIDVNDTRDSQLNPFDESARMGAKLMSKCKD